ncbi:MAG: diguanylate cyclase [Massilia sp.]
MNQGESADAKPVPQPLRRPVSSPAASGAALLPIDPATAAAHRSLKAIIIGGMLLVALVLVSLEAWSRYQARLTELSDATVAAINISRAAAEHVESTLQLVDAALYDIVEDVEQSGIERAPALQGALTARVRRTPALARMTVLDASGTEIIASLTPPPGQQGAAMLAGPTGAAGSLSPATRNAALDWHRRNPGPAPHLSDPVLEHGAWVLPLSRQVVRADGVLDGVAVATVRLDAFQTYFGEFDIGADGVFLLALDRGVLVVRRPYRPELTGSDIRRGPVFKLIAEKGSNATAVLLGLQDQTRRTYSVRRVASHPLIVVAALAHHEVLGAWYRSTAAESAVLAVALAVLFKGTRMLLAQLALRDQAEARSRRLQKELERSNRALRDMAMKDGLTGLSNRRELDSQLDMEMARASRASSSLALVMLDVDFFKLYNDTYGHAAGDACLRSVAHAIDASGRRPGDTAARFGGEEFAILLPSTDLAGARAVAIAVCEAVSNLQLPHAASELGVVTVSAGVATLRPGPHSRSSELIEAADRGLYLAKAAGRNRVGNAEPAL